MTSPQNIFVNRFFYPDHSATSQILSDLAFHLARCGTQVSVITSRGLYDEPKADLPPFEIIGDVAIYRVYRPRFGRRSLAGSAIDYLAMYQRFAAAAWRLSQPGDCLIAKTDPRLLSVALSPVARAKKISPHQRAARSLSGIGSRPRDARACTRRTADDRRPQRQPKGGSLQCRSR